MTQATQTNQDSSAERGTLLHKILQNKLAGEKPQADWDDILTDYDRHCVYVFYNAVRSIEKNIGESSGEEDLEWFHEVPITVRDYRNVPIVSGHADRVSICKKAVIVWDFKFGRKEQRAAHNNIQIRAYAVGIWDYLSSTKDRKLVPKLLKPLYAAILQASNLQSPTTIARYDGLSIDSARSEIDTIISIANSDFPHRRPGENQCRYCPAHSTEFCPETAEQAADTALIKQDAKLVSIEQLGELYRLWTSKVQPAGDAIEKRIYALLASGEEIDGLALAPQQRLRKVTDASKAFAAMSDILSAEEFASCCNVKLGKGGLGVAVQKALEAKGEKVSSSKATDIMTAKLEDADCLEWKNKKRQIVIESKADETTDDQARILGN